MKLLEWLGLQFQRNDRGYLEADFGTTRLVVIPDGNQFSWRAWRDGRNPTNGEGFKSEEDAVAAANEHLFAQLLSSGVVAEVARKTTKCNPGEHAWAPYPYTGDDTDPHFVCKKCGELGWSCNECDGEGCDDCDGGVV
jgi:hypothetical protein